MIIPDVELIAALTMSRDQAIRDNMPHCATQVQGYLDQIFEEGTNTQCHSFVVKAYHPTPEVAGLRPPFSQELWDEVNQQTGALKDNTASLPTPIASLPMRATSMVFIAMRVVKRRFVSAKTR